jgi:hypothetical protein
MRKSEWEATGNLVGSRSQQQFATVRQHVDMFKSYLSGLTSQEMPQHVQDLSE